MALPTGNELLTLGDSLRVLLIGNVPDLPKTAWADGLRRLVAIDERPIIEFREATRKLKASAALMREGVREMIIQGAIAEAHEQLERQRRAARKRWTEAHRLDEAIEREARTYRAKHPYSRNEHSTRALATHVARRVKRPAPTIRRRLAELKIR